MAGYGTVVGGYLMNATVSPNHKGDLVVQSGFKRRKLDATEVLRWESLGEATRSVGAGAAGTVGKVVAGAVLPGVVGKMASVALDATLSSSSGGHRTIRIDWQDGKQSLIKLPEKLFNHFSLVVGDRQIGGAPADPFAPSSPPPPPPAASGMGPDRPPPPPPPPAPLAPPIAHPDVIEQIAQLAVLRDQGVLTEDEFMSKKTELLSRL